MPFQSTDFSFLFQGKRTLKIEEDVKLSAYRLIGAFEWVRMSAFFPPRFSLPPASPRPSGLPGDTPHCEKVIIPFRFMHL